MTASAAVSRPTLYLVPRPAQGRAEPVDRGGTAPLRVLAAGVAASSLGTLFVPAAARLARMLETDAPLLVRRGATERWAAAIVFLLAERARLFDYPGCGTRTSFARELGASLPTLRRRAEAIRTALGPLEFDLPDPENPQRDTS